MRNHKGEIATFLTLGLVLVGGVVTLALSFLSNNQKIATNSRAEGKSYPCSTVKNTYTKGTYYVCNGKYYRNSACTSEITEGVGNYCKALNPSTPQPADNEDGGGSGADSCQSALNLTECKDINRTWVFNNTTKKCCPPQSNSESGIIYGSAQNCPNNATKKYYKATDGKYYSSTSDTTGDSNYNTICGISSDPYNPGTTVVGEGKSCCFKKKGKIYVYATHQSLVNNDMLDPETGEPDCARQSAGVIKSYQADPPGAFVCSGGASTGMSEADYEALYESENPVVEEPSDEGFTPNSACGFEDQCQEGYTCVPNAGETLGPHTGGRCKIYTPPAGSTCDPKGQFTCPGGAKISYFKSNKPECNGNESESPCYGTSASSCSQGWTDFWKSQCGENQAATQFCPNLSAADLNIPPVNFSITGCNERGDQCDNEAVNINLTQEEEEALIRSALKGAQSLEDIRYGFLNAVATIQEVRARGAIATIADRFVPRWLTINVGGEQYTVYNPAQAALDVNFGASTVFHPTTMGSSIFIRRVNNTVDQYINNKIDEICK